MQKKGIKSRWRREGKGDFKKKLEHIMHMHHLSTRNVNIIYSKHALIKKSIRRQDIVPNACNPVFRKMRQEDHYKFKVSLSYLARFCLNQLICITVKTHCY